MALAEENTLFILGAGASVPYGYPTGFQLSQEIKSCLQNIHIDRQSWQPQQENLFDVLNKLGYKVEQLEQFYRCFLGAAVYSVDKFLEKRPDHQDLGKLLIAYVLKRKEDSHRLFIKLQEDNWYVELFNRLDVTVNNIADCRISFLTFNYDRSLEVFLHSILESRTTKTSEAVIGAMASLPIVHVYGGLGNLPWTKSNGIAYDYNILPDQLKSMAEGIDIMSSERDSVQWERAHDLILNSTYIYFIGFGYDETNLSRLKIRDCMKEKTIKGTAAGIKHSRRSEITNFFDLGERNVYDRMGSYIELADEKTSIMEFLDSTVVFQKN
jgi:hypothetical protein